MKYFAISFPNFTTFLVKTEKKLEVKDVVLALSEATGLAGFGSSVYNPKYFLSVESISSPDARQMRVAKDLEKVLF